MLPIESDMSSLVQMDNSATVSINSVRKVSTSNPFMHAYSVNEIETKSRVKGTYIYIFNKVAFEQVCKGAMDTVAKSR